MVVTAGFAVAAGTASLVVADLPLFRGLGPGMVAVLLLSFGSDYNIYLVGRIWEDSEDRPLREAIVTAGASASRAIGGAGLALAGSFATLAIVPLVVFREFAFAPSGRHTPGHGDRDDDHPPRPGSR